MGVNSQYKSSVFSFLFSEPDAARELYEALSGAPLPPDTPVEINTLEGVLYRTFQNDLSFVAGGKLVVLVEHQSTINPNMAVRLFMYLARVYEKITAGENLYGKKKLVIPRPECFVLYNGTEEYPDEQVLNLSDAFADASALGLAAGLPPDLELRVKVYNINKGHNEAMLRRSEKLGGYSAFIAKAREIDGRMAGGAAGRLPGSDSSAAMKEAVEWCIAHGVLKPFFEEHGSEVANMLMNEWKLEDALAAEREEGREEGWAKGSAEGWVKGRAEAWQQFAGKALAEGLPLETIQRITGLNPDAIKNLSPRPL